MTKQFEEQTMIRQEVYKGKIIDVVVDDVLLPNNGMAKRELVFHLGAVGIMALTTGDKLILVRQYRKAIEKCILEIPAGKIEPDETDPFETAKRELEEETGYRANNMKEITRFITSPGFCNEELVLYSATDLTKIDNPRPKDDDEFLEIVSLSLKEAKEKIATGEICDAKTMYAILYWEMLTINKEFVHV